MSASDHLQPQQFDELAAKKKQKFNALLDQVPSFDEELQEASSRAPTPPRRSRLRLVK